VRVSFDSPDRGLSALIPNSLADVYVESDMQARMQMTQRAMSFINTQVGDLRKKLKESEDALQAYRDRERIVDAKGLSQSGGARQIEDMSKQLLEFRARRADAEAAYAQVTAAMTGDAGSSATLENLPAIRSTRWCCARARSRPRPSQAQRAANRWLGTRGDRRHLELKSARENLRRQLAGVAQTVRRELDLARAGEQSLERALNAAKADIANLNRKEFQLGSLERDVQNNRQLYDMFIQRLKETNISEGMQASAHQTQL
jgi:uncharacterized protein involved in exopolysaccharide biosynthesis